MKLKKKAFTLIELMVVCIIIGVLAALALPLYNKVIQRAKERAMILQLQIIDAALYMYYTKHGAYPNAELLENEATPPYQHTNINNTLGLNIPPDDVKLSYNPNENEHKVRAISPWGWNVHFHDGVKWIHCGCTAGSCSDCPTCVSDHATGCGPQSIRVIVP